jgi:hypothetical protein
LINYKRKHKFDCTTTTTETTRKKVEKAELEEFPSSTWIISHTTTKTTTTLTSTNANGGNSYIITNGFRIHTKIQRKNNNTNNNNTSQAHSHILICNLFWILYLILTIWMGEDRVYYEPLTSCYSICFIFLLVLLQNIIEYDFVTLHYIEATFFHFHKLALL